MTEELYTRKPDKVSRDYYVIEPHSHSAGRAELRHVGDIAWEGRNDRVEIHHFTAQEYKGRPVWLLASAWFDGQPFMVIFNGEDEITNSSLHRQAMDYLLSITDCQKCLEEKRAA